MNDSEKKMYIFRFQCPEGLVPLSNETIFLLEDQKKDTFQCPEGLVPLSNCAFVSLLSKTYNSVSIPRRVEGLLLQKAQRYYSYLESSFNTPKGRRPSITAVVYDKVSRPLLKMFQYPEG